jgi:hypothetical protein
VVPDLEAGNMLAKNLSFLAKAAFDNAIDPEAAAIKGIKSAVAGIVLGARVPIVFSCSLHRSHRARLAATDHAGCELDLLSLCISLCIR